MNEIDFTATTGSRITNETNKVFGRLRVTKFAGVKDRNAYWECVCECGQSIVTKGASLRSGVTQSCGCLHKERSSTACIKRLLIHGKTVGGNQRVYRIWANMISRCTNPNFDAYPYYGGRGIRVCEDWKTFGSFLRDMGEPTSGKHSIDRFPNKDGNYEPGNCRWATKLEQANNTRGNRVVEIDGVKKSVAQWALEPNAMRAVTIYGRLARGWEPGRAVFAELRER